jgi:hypothetical protein
MLNRILTRSPRPRAVCLLGSERLATRTRSTQSLAKGASPVGAEALLPSSIRDGDRAGGGCTLGKEPRSAACGAVSAPSRVAARSQCDIPPHRSHKGRTLLDCSSSLKSSVSITLSCGAATALPPRRLLPVAPWRSWLEHEPATCKPKVMLDRQPADSDYGCWPDHGCKPWNDS